MDFFHHNTKPAIHSHILSMLVHQPSYFQVAPFNETPSPFPPTSDFFFCHIKNTTVPPTNINVQLSPWFFCSLFAIASASPTFISICDWVYILCFSVLHVVTLVSKSLLLVSSVSYLTL